VWGGAGHARGLLPDGTPTSSPCCACVLLGLAAWRGCGGAGRRKEGFGGVMGWALALAVVQLPPPQFPSRAGIPRLPWVYGTARLCRFLRILCMT
jgi:hypothetical protein